MATRLYLRTPDGKFVTGDVKEAEEAFKKFGSNVVQGGRAILNEKQKRTKGVLFSDFHYTLTAGQTNLDLDFKFGRAEDYWVFVDQGVRGSGGAKKGRTSKGQISKRGGTGLGRGMGSPFAFRSKQPPLRAILEFMSAKGIAGKNRVGIAYAISLSIKRRGLERTQFFSKPLEQNIKKLPDELIKGFGYDVEKLLKKLPKELIVVQEDIGSSLTMTNF